MRAPSQERQHFHLPSARLGSAPPLHLRWLPPCHGEMGEPISKCQSDEFPAYLPKSQRRHDVEGAWESTQMRRNLLGGLGAQGTEVEAPPPPFPAPQTRARGSPAGPAWVPATQARPARCTHQVKSLRRILLSWLPILPTVPSARGSLAPALAGDSASMGSLRTSRARNPEKCSGPEDRRRCL